MQPLLHFCLVPFVVELDEAVQVITTSGLADGEALALLGGVEAVVQVLIAPAVASKQLYVLSYWQCQHGRISLYAELSILPLNG